MAAASPNVCMTIDCPGCGVIQVFRRVIDSDGTRYWVCRTCWTHIPENAPEPRKA
jgi:hypothetical protein